MKKMVGLILLVIAFIVGGCLVFTSCSSKKEESKQPASIPSVTEKEISGLSEEKEETELSGEEKMEVNNEKNEVNNENPDMNNGTTDVNNAVSDRDPEKTGSESAGNEGSRDKNYEGSWIITDEISTKGIYALSQEEIDQILGTVIRYEDNMFVSGDTNVDTPEYEESVITAEEFAQENNHRVTFSMLGIEKAEVTCVMIANADVVGDWFYVKDDDHLIVSREGVFFNAQRK